eukprot:gb/GECG01002452.1/.p1 GENE.gb/GECG01002452.1/~~gb/GECG01002452.1/.p1  ORF type:complete len:313 (+),score=22.81 gb/GECG01002452.1/:1-939(+)
MQLGVGPDLWIQAIVFQIFRALLNPIEWIAGFVYPVVVLLKGKRPAPKCIVITGATSGIGERLALDYADMGVVLGISGRSQERLSNVAMACEAKGAQVLAKVLDVTDKSAVAEWINEVEQTSPIDLVVANAGVSELSAMTYSSFEDSTRTLYSINVDGVFNTVLPTLPFMRRRKHGQVCVISSVGSFLSPLEGHSVYGSTKTAIRVWAEGLRAELSAENVGVSVVCPGFVESAMTDVSSDPMPFKMRTGDAALKIRNGLRYNLPYISFPPFISGLCEAVQGIPGNVRHFLAELGLLRPAHVSYLPGYDRKYE